MSEDLIKAAKENDVENLKKILLENKDNKHFSINYEDRYNHTALMRACDKGNYEAAELLINNGADVNVRVRNQYKNSALLRASEDHLDIGALLIKNGFDINVESHRESKIAIEVATYASKNGQLELSDLLMKKFDLNKINDAFLDACHYDKLEEAKFLLNNGADINYISVDSSGMGKTALGCKIIKAFHDSKSSFATNGHEKPEKYGYPDNDQNYQTIEFLTKNGADLEIVNYDESRDCFTSQPGSLNTFAVYGTLNIDPDNGEVRKSHGIGTALFIAASTENYKVSELLIKNGADINTKDWESDSTLLTDLLIRRNSATDQKLIAFIEKNELQKLVEFTAEIETPSLSGASAASLPVQPRTLSQREQEHAELLAMINDSDLKDILSSDPAKKFAERSAELAKQKAKSLERDNNSLALGL